MLNLAFDLALPLPPKSLGPVHTVLSSPPDLMRPMARVQWLDGWRAIAVGLVIASHLGHVYDTGAKEIPGKLGVFVFFAISGYIVTRLLLIEREESGAIDVRHFYVRRGLRILPPLAIYLAFVVALYWPSTAERFAAVRALLFTCNMALDVEGCVWAVGHTWSLSFEEQFYLLLPFALIGVAGWRTGAILFFALGFALLPFLRPLPFVGRVGFIQIYMLLGLGALFARFEPRIAPILARIPALLSLAALVLAGYLITLPPGALQIATAVLVPPAVVLGVFALPLRSRSVRWLLASPPLRVLGLYSYTLYLWQQLALSKESWNVGAAPVLNLVAAALVSAISYHTIERWFRRLATAMRRRRVITSSNS